MVILDSLLKVMDWCEHHKMPYALTGSLALAMYDIPLDGMPKDIDLIINPDEEQRKVLGVMEKLIGIGKRYPDSDSFDFMVGEVKVNMIVKDFTDAYVFHLPIPKEYGLREVPTTSPWYCIEQKLKLHRPKDIKFRDDLIKIMMSI